MSTMGIVQLVVYLVVLLALAKPLGWYMAQVYEGKPCGLDKSFGWLERLIYKICGIDPKQEMSWNTYALAMLAFNFIGFLAVFLLQRFQHVLPLNPQDLAAVSPHSSFNTAVSFATNTNWQGYGGETTLSYLVQMLGLTVQNFVSAATGMAVLVALIRGFTRKSTETIGNFWYDLTRSTLYILLPLSLVGALVLISQGVVQNFKPYQTVELLQPVKDAEGNLVTEQTIAMGPAASQIAIKQLGTNGGGFFNVNSAHPLENPTPLSNSIELLFILLIGASLCYTFGKMVGDTRQGWAVLAAMTAVFVALLAVCYACEQGGNPKFPAIVDQQAGPSHAGGNMEGKEVRHGIAQSTLWATATTAASNGSVNSMHDSYTPLGGLVPMWLMQLGEVIFGGVGSGLYGMLVFAIIGVFIAGLMVGRTPEYLGKKIQAFEMKMANNNGSAFAGISPWFILGISLWLWFTVLFANFAEAMAEGRGKAQADSLRRARTQVQAKRLRVPPEAKQNNGSPRTLPAKEAVEIVPAPQLRAGDVVLVEAGDFIPVDGEVVDGVASVDESAITGESAPVIRESGGDRSGVTGGTRVLSDWLVVRITVNPGETFLDRMIAMVEGAKRQKTPNEIALDILLAGMTIIFLLVCVTMLPFSLYSVEAAGHGTPVTVTVLVALLVCLIPTTIGGLLSAIGIAGLDRMVQANVIAMSGRAVEAAGDVNVLLLDKTGTITLGNRQAVEFLPNDGVSMSALADAAQLASLADETPEGRSVVVLAKTKYGLRGREVQQMNAHFIPFTAQTRISGVDLEGRQIRKGAADAIQNYVRSCGGEFPASVRRTVDTIAKQGGTPLVVAEGPQALGVIHLKDVVKGGIRERFIQLRQMGIQTVMITGDNPLTAAAIAAEAGVDDFLAEATPEAKLALIRKHQAGGQLVAMTGDGTNDSPALAQADVAVAMNSGTQAAKEAGNMVDLDSNPTKLIEIVEIGKQLLMTRGALTTFSLANDVAKYFAIIPAAFASTYPALDRLNIMHLATPNSAILSAVIFNALIIVALIPLALRGVKYRPVGAARLLRDNLLIYGLGGLFAPFIGIKLIDMLLVLFQLT